MIDFRIEVEVEVRTIEVTKGLGFNFGVGKLLQLHEEGQSSGPQLKNVTIHFPGDVFPFT
jgi:hypothetical protein